MTFFPMNTISMLNFKYLLETLHYVWRYVGYVRWNIVSRQKKLSPNFRWTKRHCCSLFSSPASLPHSVFHYRFASGMRSLQRVVCVVCALLCTWVKPRADSCICSTTFTVSARGRSRSALLYQQLYFYFFFKSGKRLASS